MLLRQTCTHNTKPGVVSLILLTRPKLTLVYLLLINFKIHETDYNQTTSHEILTFINSSKK